MKAYLCQLLRGVLLLALSCAGSIPAATITWDNPAGGEWATAANWSPQQVPGASDVAVIDGNGTFTINVTGTRSASGLVMANPNATLRLGGLANNSTLTVANGFENQGTIELTSQTSSFLATLNVTSGALTNAVGGVVRVLQGAAGSRTLGLELDNRGTLQIERTTSLSKSDGQHRFGGTVDLAGGTTLTIVGTGAAAESTHAGAAWTGTGTLDLPSGRPFILETDFTLSTITLNLQSVIVQGPGTLTVPPGHTLTLQTTTMNAPLNLLGTLENLATSSITSPFGVPANATLRLGGQAGNSTLTVADGFENQGTIELTSQTSGFLAALNVTSGALTNAVGGVVRILQGAAGSRTLGLELDNRGTLQIERNTSLSKSDGQHRFAGTVDLAGGTTLTIVGTGAAPESRHAGANWTGTGTLDLPTSRPFILETDFTLSTITLNLQSVIVQGPGTLTVPPGHTLTLQNTTMNAPLNLLGTLENLATSSITSPFGVPANATLRLGGQAGNSTLTVADGFINQGTIELTSQTSGFLAALNVTSGALTNAVGGVVRVLQGAAGNRTLGLELDNRGTLQIERNTSLSKSDGQHRNSGLIEVRVGELTLTQSGSSPSFSNEGELRVLAGATFRPTAGNWTNTATGVLSGAGTLNLTSGTLANLGTVSPGVSPGILAITGNYPSATSTTLQLELGGAAPGTGHDQLAVSSAANLDGKIRAALIDGFFPKQGDAFTVLTYGSRNGEFASLESAEPDRIAWEVQYGSTSAQLVVLNSAPALAAINDLSLNELTALSLTASATDQDLPAQTLTYSLDTAPAGMIINPSSGQFIWTPTEAQGPGDYDVTVRVTDNGTPALAHTTSFSVTVNEVNVAPLLVLPLSQSVAEQVELVFTINGTDSDIPANTLTYELVSGPEGATFNPATREFRWTPTEAQGPGNFTATFRVTDNNPDAVNTQQLNAEGDVSIAVAEVNLPPVLATVPDAVVHAGTPFTTQLSATDPDLPANTFTYSLVNGPAGATVSPTGAVNWTPSIGAAGTSANFTVRVTDNGVPAQSDDETFQVTVTGTLAVLGTVRTGNQLEITWRAIPGKTYRLVSSDALPATLWSPVTGDVPATGATASKTIIIGALPGGNYFQVEQLGN